MTDTGSIGFTWGETEGLYWLRNDDGDYKRIDPEFVDTLRALETGDRDASELSEEERTAFEHLREGGFVEADAPVQRIPTPDDLRLLPRSVAFAVAFALLTAYVGYRLVGPMPVPTAATATSSGLQQLLLSLPVFVVLALVHEGGHYLAARPYFDASLELSRLNGVFPAIVTRTNHAWRCPRSVRVWIDLAGPFADVLQCLVLAGASLFVWPGAYLLAVVPVFEYVRILFSLNPLVRGDGYWMIVDWFGATNLYTRGLEDLKNADVTIGALYAVGSLAFTVLGAGMMVYFVATLAGII